MQLLLLLGFGCLLVGVAFVAAVAVAVVRMRAKRAQEPEDPLGAMFRQNEDAYDERRREALDALPPGDPLRKWVARAGQIGWLGLDENSLCLSFEEDAERTLAAVRAVHYAGDKQPNFRGLPAVEQPFGIDLSKVVVSDRGLAPLTEHASLTALSLVGKPSVTDATLKTVAQMADLTMLDIRYTEVTPRGLRHLTELTALRYLALYLPYDFEEAAEYLREMTGLAAIGGGSSVTDDALRALRPLTRLTHLDLADTVTDAGLAHLAPFGRLLALRLSSVGVTDAGLAHLRALGALQKLELRTGADGVRGPGLASLAGLNELRELNVAGNGLVGPGLECFAAFPRLHALDLDHNPIGDAGLARLRLPPALDRLNLGWTQGTDAGIARLELPPAVTRLNLYAVPVTDASVPHLARFTSLRHLGVAETKLTLAGAERLAEALPGCEIQTSFPK